MRTDNLAPARVSAGNLMNILSTAFNAILVVAMTLTAMRLWGMSSDYMGNAGGLPSPTILDSVLQEITLALSSPAELAKSHWDSVYARFYWWTLGWVSGVFAIGAGLVSIAGLRWAWISVQEYIAR